MVSLLCMWECAGVLCNSCRLLCWQVLFAYDLLGLQDACWLVVTACSFLAERQWCNGGIVMPQLHTGFVMPGMHSCMAVS